MKKMGANSWVAIECLALLGLFGALAFFWTPKYTDGVYLIIGALIAVLNQVLGAKTGASMPEQKGDAKPVEAPPAVK